MNDAAQHPRAFLAEHAHDRHRVGLARPSGRLAAGLLALACASALSGCAVAMVAGAAAGAAISVTGAVVSSGVKVTGKVVEKTIDLVTPSSGKP